jgi:CRISPR-associated protein Csb1
MSVLNLESLKSENRILFAVKLKPVLGDRFQPTGFPSLGAAQYKTAAGQKLLVESAQSMANRMEVTCWDSVRNAPVDDLEGISHVAVTRGGKFLTDSMLESHRINSPYLLEGKDKTFIDLLKKELGGLDIGPIDRKRLAEILFKYDVGSLIHGVFLAKSELAGGRLRIARAVSAFIEASQVEVAASGGVKNDHVNPSGDTKSGFGNVPFARDEYVAEEINCYINLDLAQVRGYGLDPKATELLVLLSLYRIRKMLDGDMRLRTACDLEPVDKDNFMAMRPSGFALPSLSDLSAAVKQAITNCKDMMVQTTVKFEDDMKKAKEVKETTDSDDENEQGDV